MRYSIRFTRRKKRKMSIAKVVNAIRRHKRFLVSGHVDPEADTIGSQLALASLLKRLGKEVIVVDQDPPPDSCAFLPRLKELTLLKDVKKGSPKKFDCAIIVDCPTLDRIGKVKDLITDGITIINIDHHISNVRFGDVNWVDLNAAADGEMIFDIFKKFRMKLTKDEAVIIYSSILIDTGSFRYSNTTARTHIIAAELMKYGVDTNSVFEHLFELKSYPATRLLGLALLTLKRSRDGKVIWLWLTNKILKQAVAKYDDAENFINYARAVKGCKVALFFKEAEEKGIIKVSFRGKKGIDVNKIAAKFGGGGHARAAGCTIKATAREAETKVLKEVLKVV